MAISREQAVDLIRHYDFSVPATKITKHLALSAAVVIGKESAGTPSSTSSYFGGRPHLPLGEAWPTWNRTEAVQDVLPEYRSKAEPGGLIGPEYVDELEAMLEQPEAALSFIGQVNLDEIHCACELPNLPGTGVMQFFYDHDIHCHGFDPRLAGGFRVLCHASTQKLAPVEPPAALRPEQQYPARAISFRSMWTIPHWQSDDIPVNADDEEEYYLYIDLVDELEQASLCGDYGSGRLGGWAPFIQGDLRLNCQLQSHGIDPMRQYDDKPDKRINSLARGKRDWKLLLQIDSAKEMGWCWGDAGFVYFYGLEKESRAGDLTGACCMQQC